VTDLPGDIRRAVKQATIENESAADAGANRYADHVSAALGSAAPPLAERRAVCVVVERGRQPHAFGDLISQRKISPTKIGCDDHDAALAIQRPG